jgi:ferritin-like metal-binding protein YciE
MSQEDLKELFIDELKDLYSAENQLVKALPKMAKAATSEELKTAFTEHLEQTKGHVARLEQIFEALEESPRGKKCAGMEGLIKEGQEAIEEDYEGAVKDAALIGAAQRVEHYEIAAYGTAKALAEVLGESDHAATLDETLEEEKETDEKLTENSEQVNEEATTEEEEESEEAPPSREKKKASR